MGFHCMDDNLNSLDGDEITVFLSLSVEGP